MSKAMLRRRELLKLTMLAGLSGLVSCGFSSSRNPLLMAPSETLPKRWRGVLPSSWTYKPFASSPEEREGPFQKVFDSSPDLIALGDGWLEKLTPKDLQPIDAPLLYRRLGTKARDFLSGLDLDMAPMVLPVGVSPWVLLFRRGSPWLEKASQEGWQVLLDPALKDLVLLPNSPRLIISLADQIELPNALFRLRNQARIVDDRNSLNWLLKREARVAVLPLDRCLRRLSQDPRLDVVLPINGAPLNWTLLVRPASTFEPLPQSWVQEAWGPALAGKLLSEGWIPSLDQDELRKEIGTIPEAYQPLVLPEAGIWSRCWSLLPLKSFEKKDLQRRWDKSTP